MKYKIQVHFANQGQLEWVETIEDLRSWTNEMLQCDAVTTTDERNGRHICYFNNTVTALLIDEYTDDPLERIYAPAQRQEQESNIGEHQGNGSQWTPTTPGGSSCPFNSPQVGHEINEDPYCA